VLEGQAIVQSPQPLHFLSESAILYDVNSRRLQTGNTSSQVNSYLINLEVTTRNEWFVLFNSVIYANAFSKVNSMTLDW
jgi:hypothetical protein